MDIANYLSELLGRHTEVSVPGLGCFSQLRVNGYYNDAEATFYPPYYKVSFDPQPKDDEILTSYIAEKKKISLASSKYFTEKYITSLKQEAALTEVPFADLGWFYIKEGRVEFKPQDKTGTDAAFYGFAPVKLNKTDHIPAPPPSVPPQPLPVSIPLQDPATDDQPEYVNEETETRRGVSIWIILLIILVVLAAAAFGIYKYDPALLNLQQQPKPYIEKPKAKPVIAPDTLKADSLNKTDTTAKTISAPGSTLNKPVTGVDTIAKPEFVIFVGSFKTKTKSQEAINDYKRKGVDARILSGPGTGPRIKIIVGSFTTSTDAEIEKHKLIAAKKISKDSYTQQITNPTK